MESPTITSRLPLPEPGAKKTLESLSSAETNTLVHEAIKAQKKFLAWSEKNSSDPLPAQTVAEKFAEAPSKKVMTAALSAVGLVNVGLTLAADKLGLSPIDTFLMWYASFGAPVLEELIFRSKKIPNFISLVGDKAGIPVRQDKARLSTNALFAVGHVHPFRKAGENAFSVLNAFGASGTLSKLSHEHGMAASVSLHAVWNATMGGAQYLFEGTDLYRKHNIGTAPLVEKLIGNESRYNLVKNIYKITQISAIVGIGIIGVKEMLADKKLHDMLERLQSGPEGQSLVNFEEVLNVSKKLLASPSMDGYKFRAGVELGYVHAALTMPKELRSVMSVDDYARSQVHTTVSEIWKESKTIDRRLDKTNTYITEQIAKRVVTAT